MKLNEDTLLSDLQKRAVARLVRARGGVVWWKVGEGKTRIALAVFARLQDAYHWEHPSICLVVCRRKAFTDWTEEIERCLPCAHVYTDNCPIRPLTEEPVFLLVSEGMLSKEVATLQQNRNIRLVVFDELWMYANHKSLKAKAARAITMPRKAIGLSGTVMKARDTFEIYAQLMAVRKEKYLAPTPTTFRTTFQICRGDMGFPTFHPKKGSYAQIMSTIDEVADVNFPTGTRRIHEQYHTVPATQQQRRYFHELREFFSIDEHGLEFHSALAIGIKAQQISNGWLKKEEGNIIHFPSAKAEKLRDELQDIVSGGDRAVVWCAFRYDVTMLAAYLPFATVQMLGGQEFDLARWRSDDVRICLATEASGSSVNHFDQTAYAIYFSSNYKWKDMQQSRGRSDRKSSLHRNCYYKYLQVEGSLDNKIYRAALASGDSEARLLLQAGIRDWLKS